MNFHARIWGFATVPFIDPKKLVLRGTLGVVALSLATLAAQAATVSVNLGPTAQNITLAGGGLNGSGLGTYPVITLGTCASSGGSTSCTLSGNFTGSTTGFTSGTYSIVTTYPGIGPSPLQGVEISSGSDFWTFSSVAATITMYLTSNGGTVTVPITGPTGASLGFLYATQTCSGTAVSACSVAQVGATAGSIITGPSTGTASFTQSSAPTYTYYFSHLAVGAFAAGAGSFQSTLTYVNYSPQAVTCTTNFYLDSGSPWSIPFTQGSVATRTDTLQAGASVHDQSTASLDAPGVQGWGQATCTGPVQASMLYRLYQQGVATGEAGVNAEAGPTTEFATFAQTATGIAYANPSASQSATITVAVYSAAGAKLGSQVITLGPLAHGAENLGPALGLNAFTGFVKITSSIPIVSLSLNAEVFPVFSSLPPGDLPSTTALVP